MYGIAILKDALRSPQGLRLASTLRIGAVRRPGCPRHNLEQALLGEIDRQHALIALPDLLAAARERVAEWLERGARFQPLRTRKPAIDAEPRRERHRGR